MGRDAEVTLVLDRWAQVTDGLGQIVLLSGEGIGKSRLVQVLITAQKDEALWLERRMRGNVLVRYGEGSGETDAVKTHGALVLLHRSCVAPAIGRGSLPALDH